jgi:hypothetical protein
MNIKAYLAALAGAVFSFLGGWVIFGMLLMDFYMANTTSYEGLMKTPMPDLVFIFLSGLSASFLLTIIFTKWANVKTFGSGFTTGMTVYFFVIISFNLSMYGFYNLMNITLVFVDTLAQTIFGGLMGGIIGFILGTGKKE